ncbi:hypothetical protein D3C78_1829750 [compost metagenome]
MRRLAHFDRQLVLFRQGKETAREIKNAIDLLLWDAMPLQIEEAHRAGDAAQFVKRRRPLGMACRKALQIENGQG